MLQLLKITPHQYNFLPGILPDEVDDALVFGEAFFSQFGHGAEDEDLIVRGHGAAGGAGGDQAGEILDSGPHAGGVGVVGVQDDVVTVFFDELAAAIGGGIGFDRLADG